MKVYILTLAIFTIAKLVFMLVNYEGHAFDIGDVFNVIRHGLTLDLSTSLYFLILPQWAPSGGTTVGCAPSCASTMPSLPP